MGLIAADTTFLIDLQRDSGPVRDAIRTFLQTHGDDEFCVSVTALGEFAAGFPDLNDGAYLAVRRRLEVAEQDEGVATTYAKIFRELKKNGKLIGANDLWIAASAIRHGAALVTRNREEFQRIPGLKVLGY
jgi:predicted nucleic acid-binding protein